MALVKIQGVPDWLFKSVAFCTGLFVVATLAMMVYYGTRFILLGVGGLSRITFARVSGNRFNPVEPSTSGGSVLRDLKHPPYEEIVKKGHR